MVNGVMVGLVGRGVRDWYVEKDGVVVAGAVGGGVRWGQCGEVRGPFSLFWGGHSYCGQHHRSPSVTEVTPAPQDSTSLLGGPGVLTAMPVSSHCLDTCLIHLWTCLY